MVQLVRGVQVIDADGAYSIVSDPAAMAERLSVTVALTSTVVPVAMPDGTPDRETEGGVQS